MKKIIGLLVLAVVALSVVPAQAQKKSAKKAEEVTFVTNIDCEGCAKKVLNVIPFKKGVKDVVVDVPTKVIKVTFDTRKSDVPTLIGELKKIDVEVVSVNGHKLPPMPPHGEFPPKFEGREGHDHDHAGHNHDHAGHNHDHAGHNH